MCMLQHTRHAAGATAGWRPSCLASSPTAASVAGCCWLCHWVQGRLEWSPCCLHGRFAAPGRPSGSARWSSRMLGHQHLAPGCPVARRQATCRAEAQLPPPGWAGVQSPGCCLQHNRCCAFRTISHTGTCKANAAAILASDRTMMQSTIGMRSCVARRANLLSQQRRLDGARLVRCCTWAVFSTLSLDCRHGSQAAACPACMRPMGSRCFLAAPNLAWPSVLLSWCSGCPLCRCLPFAAPGPAP